MGWEIRANLGKHVRAGVDARGWLWEITRGAGVAQVVIEVAEDVLDALVQALLPPPGGVDRKSVV